MKTHSHLLAVLAASALAFPAAAAPAVKLKVTPEREAVHPGSDPTAVMQIEVTARPSEELRRIPLNLALVLDRSGSMSGAKLEKARQAACVAVDQLRNDDIFSLVIYDDEVEVLIPPQKVEDRKALEKKINRIEAGGSTALHEGVQRGAAQLRKFLDDERVNRVILLSDGLANVGPSSPGELAKLGKKLRREDLSVSTIGLGDDYNEDLMTALAEASHANYYYVKDAEKLPGIFEEELGSVQSIVARKVEIIITLAEDIDPGEVLGEEELVFEGRTLRIPVEDLPGSQTRRFLIACKVPDSARTRANLGTVELAYEDSATGERKADQQSASVRIAESRQVSEETVQAEVLSNVAITQNRLAKEKAVRLADEGRSKDAAEILRRQIETNAALPAAAKSALIAGETQVLKQKAAELESTGSLGKASRKEIQYQNYQDKKQKR